MHTFNGTLKVLLAAGLIAFASTVSAVHVHPLTVCENDGHLAFQSELDMHDCVFCWVVYQTLTVDSNPSAILINAEEREFGIPSPSPLRQLSHIRYGRAPPALV